jgi:LPS-assembly protein
MVAQQTTGATQNTPPPASTPAAAPATPAQQPAAAPPAAPASPAQQPVTAGPPPLPDRKTLPQNVWIPQSDFSASDGKHDHLWGHAVIENNTLLIKADDIEYDEETGTLTARGNVYFHQFDRNEQLWCDEVEYDTDTGFGRFYGNVRGESMPKVVVRKGVLTGNSPFHFEGEWAERLGDPTYDYKYILHDGWITNCVMPNPWWRMKGPKFDIIPYERAIAYKSTFFLKKFPVMIFPMPFYHSLKKQERKSGFLFPNIVPRSQRGPMIGLGYYWAINRSYDLTYRFQDYNTNALGSHVDFRGKPTATSDFDFIAMGVYDMGGQPGSGTPAQRYTGDNIYFTGKADLGNGWMANSLVNYVSSFRFKQEWSESYNDAIGAEIHALAFVKKDFSYYTFEVEGSRVENFQNEELQITNPNGSFSYLRDAVLIHKLPESNFDGRNKRIKKKWPIWFSFDSSAGLYYRSEPLFEGTTTTQINNFETKQFTPRLRFAPRISSVVHWLGIDFTPSLGLDETFYGESQVVTYNSTYDQLFYNVRNASIIRSAHDFTLDIKPPSLERVFNKKTIFGDKLKHVIEPRITYKYLSGIGADFNRFIRFDENDLLANTNEVTLSLTNRIYAKRGDTVQEIFTWELMQKRYFNPTFGGALLAGQRNVLDATADVTAYSFLLGPRTYSPVASIIRANPVGGITFQWMADYDPLYHRIVDTSVDVGYTFKKNWHANFGDNEVHSNPLLTPYANQYHFTLGLGNAQRRGWNAAGTVAYDVREQKLLYEEAQVTFNTDCCGFSAQYRRINVGLRDETQLFISFAIANVGTFGTLRKQDTLF